MDNYLDHEYVMFDMIQWNNVTFVLHVTNLTPIMSDIHLEFGSFLSVQKHIYKLFELCSKKIKHYQKNIEFLRNGRLPVTQLQQSVQHIIFI